MIKFILCDDSTNALDRASQAVTKTMMNYDIEYRIHKFTRFDDKLKPKNIVITFNRFGTSKDINNSPNATNHTKEYLIFILPFFNIFNITNIINSVIIIE